MAGKSVLTKFFELAMECQTRQAKKEYQKIKAMPEGSEKQKAMNELRNLYNTFMNDCNNVLETEKQWIKIQSN